MDALPMLNEESSGAVPTRKKSVLWVTLSAAVLVVVGIVGYSQSTPRVHTVHRLQAVQSKILAVAARMLEGDTEQALTFESIVKEEGTDDPSTMAISAELLQEKDEVSDPEWILTFAAKTGKGAELVRLFKNLKQGAIEFEQAMSGDEASSMLEKVFTIEAGGEDECVIKAKAPQVDSEKQTLTYMSDVWDKHVPSLLVEMKFGRSIDTIFDHINQTLPLLFGGFSAKVTSTLSTEFYGLFQEGVTSRSWVRGRSSWSLGVPEAFSKFDSVQKFEYNKKLAADFDRLLPNLGDAEGAFRDQVLPMVPESIKTPLVGLDEFADGVKSLKLVGLPMKYAIEFKMTNFHIAPLLKTLMSDIAA